MVVVGLALFVNTPGYPAPNAISGFLDPRKSQIEALRGIRNIELLVVVDSDGKDKLSKEAVTALVSSTLRRSGIPLFNAKSKDMAMLVLSMELHDVTAGFYAFTFALQLKGMATTTVGHFGLVSLYHDHILGSMTVDRVPDGWREMVQRLLDTFLDDYFKANPVRR